MSYVDGSASALLDSEVATAAVFVDWMPRNKSCIMSRASVRLGGLSRIGSTGCLWLSVQRFRMGFPHGADVYYDKNKNNANCRGKICLNYCCFIYVHFVILNLQNYRFRCIEGIPYNLFCCISLIIVQCYRFILMTLLQYNQLYRYITTLRTSVISIITNQSIIDYRNQSIK